MSLNSYAKLKVPAEEKGARRKTALDPPRIGKFMEMSGDTDEDGLSEPAQNRKSRFKKQVKDNPRRSVAPFLGDDDDGGDDGEPSSIVRLSLDEPRYGSLEGKVENDVERGENEDEDQHHKKEFTKSRDSPLPIEGAYHGSSWGSCKPRLPSRRAVQRMVCNWSTIKITLIMCFFVFTLWLFTSNDSAHDAEEVLTHSAATSFDHPLIHPLKNSRPKDFVGISVTAQKLEEDEDGTKLPVNVTFHVESQNTDNGTWISVDKWSIALSYKLEEVDHHYFNLDDTEIDIKSPLSSNKLRIVVRTNSVNPIGMKLRIRQLGWMIEYQVGIAAIVLVLVYILLIFELMHRTIVALVGSFAALGVLSSIQSRPAFVEIISWIDFDTIGLLFGMMIMVGIFSDTGFFEYTAVKAYKLSKGRVWRLLVILCILIAVLSAFLDSVTTILLLAPVTIRLCKVIDLDPVPLILAEVIFCNIGGTATALGDPPNIMIVNDPKIVASGKVDFGNFLLHVGPGVAMAMVVCLFVLKFMYRKKLQRMPSQTLARELDIWRRTAERMRVHDSEEERVVQMKLFDYVKQLELEVEKQQLEADTNPEVGMIDISELEDKYKITDMPLFIKCCTVLLIVILLFFLHSFVEVNLNLAWIAIIGAMVMLVVSGIHDVETVLEKIEIGTLLFFAGLFVLMHTLEEMELMSYIADLATEVVGKVPEGDARLAVAVLVIIWIGAIVGSFIDNIPFTKAMLPIVNSLANANMGLPLQPLVWALAYGTCLGGNGTIIGASANVVAAGLAEQQGHPITFVTFFKVGMPQMLVSVAVASVYMLIFHVVIPWYDD
eukprot:TRINITY_DN877_c0_g1_i4.p1 TRINITY_DN877_c0_g1~~TRINITY_DN877_c0_g1_i4.p1  ORF type:complete len:827 (+),score=150.75 TRINITY_DN877_c0_g1_i4:438-2918(+)